jgi:hypothetical protein
MECYEVYHYYFVISSEEGAAAVVWNEEEPTEKAFFAHGVLDVGAFAIQFYKVGLTKHRFPGQIEISLAPFAAAGNKSASRGLNERMRTPGATRPAKMSERLRRGRTGKRRAKRKPASKQNTVRQRTSDRPPA